MMGRPFEIAGMHRGYHLAVRLFAALALAVICSVQAVAAESEPDGKAPARTVVFVGERLSIESLPDPCEEEFKKTGVLDCVSMDSLYRVTYRVVQPVIGGTAGEEMRFSVADHYGFPYFARFGHALLFVSVGEDGSWLYKYQAVPMHRTGDGQWAACGDVKSYSDEKLPIGQARPMTFDQPILPLQDLEPADRDRLSSRWKRERGTYRISHGQVHCLKGVPVESAYEVMRQNMLTGRQVSLPAWPAVP